MGVLKGPIIDPYVTTWGHNLGPRCVASLGASSWVFYVASWVNVKMKVQQSSGLIMRQSLSGYLEGSRGSSRVSRWEPFTGSNRSRRGVPLRSRVEVSTWGHGWAPPNSPNLENEMNNPPPRYFGIYRPRVLSLRDRTFLRHAWAIDLRQIGSRSGPELFVTFSVSQCAPSGLDTGRRIS